MKKILIYTCIYCWVVNVYGQNLQDGSIAPDFTVTDVNGNRHSLSGYLNAGKTVILEFSGVGCGHSWQYLRTEALQDFYYAYGSPGSNQAEVLFIEASTTIDELKNSYHYGFGNWLDGTPFPMILDTGLHSLYRVNNYVPVFYRICADGKLKNIGQLSAAAISTLINNDCGALTGVNNYGRLISNANQFCGKTGSFTTTLKNYGKNNITSATLKLKENGREIGTQQFTGNIPQFSAVSVQFNAVNINPAASYSTELADVNGVPNYNPSFSVTTLPFTIATHTNINLLVKTHTTLCPASMSWEITNSSGNIIAHNNSYGVYGPNCDWTNGGKIMEQQVVLPDTKDCYSLILKSADGYGWKNYGYDYIYQREVPGIELFSNGNIVFSKTAVGNFGSEIRFENFLTTKDSSDFLPITPPQVDNTLPIIFPNPSHGIIHIKTDAIVSMRIVNLMGQTVFSSKTVNSNASINLSNLKPGIYLVKIIGLDHKVTTQKLVLNH